MPLREEAVIVRLNISQWTARKFDKKASLETTAAHGAVPDVARVNKLLIAKEAMSNLQRIVTNARVYHNENTAAWDDQDRSGHCKNTPV